jgi:PAS domain S-box-containing protein
MAAAPGDEGTSPVDHARYAILDEAPNAFMAIDRAWRYAYINAAGARLVGHTPDSLVGQVIWEVFPEAVGSPFWHAYHRAMEERKAVRLTDHYQALDLWFEIEAYPIETGIAVHFRDVTELKRAEAGLRQFKFMVDRSPEEAYLVSPDGALAYVNEAAAGSLGYTTEELLRLGVAGIDPAFGPLFAAHFEALKAGPLPAFETVHLAKDGRRVTKELRSVYLRLGEHEYVCGFGHDITARKEVERRAQQNLQLERMLRQVDQRIIDQAEVHETLGVICRAVVDLGYLCCWVGLAEADGTVRTAVTAGEVPDYLASRRVRWDDSPEGRGPTGLALRQGQPHVCANIAEDPDYAPWHQEATRLGFGSSIAIPLLSFDREVLGTLNAYRSAVGGFSAEDLETLQTLGGQCSVAMLGARRQHALRDAERQLAASQRMEAVGSLAGGIAHDFNNLLTGIIAFAQFQRERLAADPEAAEDLDQILASAGRGSALTRQLLALARRQVLEPVPLDLNQLLGDLLRLLGRVLGEHIELQLDLAPGLPAVLADAGQLEQVLMNLVVNARDSMPTGGTLHLATREAALDDRQAPSGKAGRYVVVSVRDTGTGIDESLRERIFEPFFTTKPQGRGTGLGLAVSYGIVKQHGGLIAFRSQVGKGTTFEVTLPTTSSLPDGRRATTEPVVRGGSETVLVAEDEPVIRAMAERTLVRLGYRVLLASDGEEALALFREHRGAVDLALLDVVMPRLHGTQALDAMRAQRPGLRAILMSGYADEILREPAGAWRAVPFLTKPFSPDELARRVRQVLDGPADR